MKTYTPSRAPCPIARAARVLGDRWVLLILRDAFLGAERFEEFVERLGINRAALTSRLAIMQEAGLIRRDPPEGKRARYILTDKACALEPLFGEHAAFSCDEGSPRTDLELAFPHLDLSRLDEIWWPEMEETAATMQRRMAEARAVLAARDDRAHLAVVCHWGVIRALAGLTVGNCDIVPFEP
jgi:DNA-binding HxlR family transcriptional regulator